MRRKRGLMLLMASCLTLLFGCGKSDKETVTNRNIPIDDITAFYYTVENINFNASYQRYRFSVEDGAYLFDYETRERPGDYGPTTEADITASVTGLSGFDITADTASGTANTYTGTVTYTLPVGATLTVRETGADEYNVEAGVSSAEDLDGSDEAVKFTVPENGAAVTFRNTPKGEQVRILVVDGDTGEPLSGTSFTLTGFGTLDGDADGLLFEGALIRNETYSLAETEAPSGYDKAQPVDILVSAGDVSLSHNNGVSVELGEDGVWVITVNNYKTPIAPTGFAQNFLPYLWILLLGLMMLLLALVSLALGIMAGRSSAVASTGFAANLRKAMYRNIQRFAFSDIDKYSTSGLVTRMTTDVQNLQQAFQQILRVTVRAPFRLVLSVVMCLVIDPRLSLIFIVAMLVLGVSLWQIISRVSRLFQQVFEKYDVLNESVQENVAGIRVVKAFVREQFENEKFARAAEALYKLYVRAESLMALNHPVMNMVVYGCMIALSWWGAHFIVGGTLTTGELTSLFTYVMSILQALMMLSMIFVMLTQSAASAKRVCEVINEEPDIVNPENPVMEVEDGRVEFCGVRFDYQSKQAEGHSAPIPQREGQGGGASSSRRSALFNVTFSIASGETIGVLGGTGSGKSTLISLISRLYDVGQGTVSVGGRNVKEYDLKTLRQAVAVVLQQNTLFTGTILDNLRWGRGDASLEECREACRMAQADGFIMEMPQQYNTHIEQGGTNVSGGQKQRLCIARALLRRPKILILDDSTSACDTDTDRKIQQAFRSQLPGMTKIIIAQRISTVQHCDRILVMEGGHVTGFDTHERLLESNQFYREVNDLQSMGSGDFDGPHPNSSPKGG